MNKRNVCRFDTHTVLYVIENVVRLILTIQTMEPHCYCHVRAASYLLPDADVIILLLSTAAALCLARAEDGMSPVRDFVNVSKNPLHTVPTYVLE